MVFCVISLCRKSLLETSYITYVRNLNAYSRLFNYSALNCNSISDCISVRNLLKHQILLQFLKKKKKIKQNKKAQPLKNSIKNQKTILSSLQKSRNQDDLAPLKNSFKHISIENRGNFFDSTIIQVTVFFPSDMSIVFSLILFSVFKTLNSLKQTLLKLHYQQRVDAKKFEVLASWGKRISYTFGSQLTNEGVLS